MSSAFDDLSHTLGEIYEIAKGLGTPEGTARKGRSKEAIQLNGLQVVAFAALEDFVRRRVYEVLAYFGQSDISFENLPDTAREFLLTETIAGLSFALDRADADDRLTLLQLEGLLLGAAADPTVAYEPSEYVFGRSSSNVSTTQLRTVMEALGVEGGLSGLAEISKYIGYSHLGAPDQIFKRFSKNRNNAAHGFGLDFRISDFLTDVRSAGLIFAFAFDTCISQSVFQYTQTFKKQHPYEPFNASDVKLRILAFNTQAKKWQVLRNGYVNRTIPKGTLDNYIDQFAASVSTHGESLIVIDETSSPVRWVQPV